MGDPVVHFEINGTDVKELASFYGELLGWHIQEVPGNYALIETHGGGGVNGGIGQVEDGTPNLRVYAAVADPQALLDKAQSLGAETVTPVTEIPDMVTYATFRDPQGNVFGVVKSGEGPGVQEGDGAPVDWFEILGPDPEALRSFYGDLFGWPSKESQSAGGDWQYFEVEGAGIGGGIGSSPDGQSHLNIYASVDDVQKYFERAETSGGKGIMPPQKMGENLTFALFADPQGIPFGLYSYSPA